MEEKDLKKLIGAAEKTATIRLYEQKVLNKDGTIPYEYVQRETTNVLLAIMIWKNAEYHGD